MIDPRPLKDLMNMSANVPLRLQLFFYEMTIHKNMFGPLMKDEIRGNSNAI